MAGEPKHEPDIREALRDAAVSLAAIARDLGLKGVASTIEADTTRRLDQGRLRVVVLGEIKHGKSSLVNALVGRKLLPIGVTPTTGALVRVRSGMDPGCFFESADGRTREPLDTDRFERLVRGDETGEGLIEVVTPPGSLPDAVEIVDTPGFNDMAKFRAALSRAELPRADALVLVLDATQVLSRTELDLLRNALRSVGGLDGSGASLELVINRIDLVAEKDRPLLIDHVKSQLQDLLRQDATPYLTDARAAAKTPTSSELGVTEVLRLRARIAELAEGRGHILPARARAALLRQARLLAYNAAIQARALTLEEEALHEEIASVERALAVARDDLGELRKRITGGCDEIRTASRDRVATFREGLEQSARDQIHRADLRSLTHVVPGAIQDAFLDFVQRESARVREALDELTREVIHTHGEAARRHLYDATLRLGFRGPEVYVEPPSVAIEAGMVVLGIAGTAVMYFGSTVPGLAMTIASPLVTLALREKSLRDARKHTYDILPRALEATTTALDDSIGHVIDRHGGALDEHLALADQALGEQLLATLRTAEQRLAEHSPASSGTSQIDEDKATRAAELRIQLAALEGRLSTLTARIHALFDGAPLDLDALEASELVP